MPTLSVEERPNIPAVRTPQDKAHVVAFALGTLHSIVNAALFLHLFSHSGWGGWTTAVGGSVIIMAFIHWIFFLLQILPKRDLLFDKYYKLRAWQRWIVSALLSLLMDLEAQLKLAAGPCSMSPGSRIVFLTITWKAAA